jgi:hypothetical protein
LSGLCRHHRAADLGDQFLAQVVLFGFDRQLQLFQAPLAQRAVRRPVGLVERPARRGDGPVHVLGLSGRGASKHKASRGADVVELGTGRGRHKFAVDEHA